MRHLAFILTLALALLAASPCARAQTPPSVDAGSLRHQIEQGLKPAAPAPKAALAVEPAPVLSMPGGVSVQVRAFGFAGNTLLPDTTLQQAVQPYVGKALGFAELQRAAQAVADAYRDAGWVVRTLLPEQDVSAGHVTIQVIEAQFAGARLVGEPPTRVRPEIVLGFITAQQRVGAPVSAAALDRALLLADDLPGVALRGALEPADSDRGTLLALSARDEPLWSADASLDNLGARATGEARAMLAARLASPLELGDRAQAVAVASRGSHYARAAYDLPVGAQGLRVGATLSDFAYRVIATELAPLSARGHSRGYGVEATYPLLRSRTLNVQLALSHQREHLLNAALGLTMSDYGYATTTLGVSAQGQDDGGASAAYGLALLRGNKALGQLNLGESAATAGGESIVRMNASREQPLAPEWSLYGALAGQWASREIDSSQRMVLGGPTGVRAYPVGEASGSRGRIGNVELRWRPTSEAMAALFVDAGQVSGSATTRRTTLRGAGLAFTWTDPSGLSLRATWATRLGHNPNAGPKGTDQDGSLHRHRLWLQLSFSI